ncbi:DUF2845 domain-containing protein [Ferrimonas pelagia]|uniref:DUF2845 domain-containing protein n=1 Tax=Ferrimonas pelagia TaxID=1177826 RepID=A0ABP9FGM4_9GAMM
MRKTAIGAGLILLACQANGLEKQVHSARCGTDLVKLGDSKSTLLNHCGKPFDSDSVGKSRKEYHYQRSKTGPITVFQIHKGKITEIRLVR